MRATRRRATVIAIQQERLDRTTRWMLPPHPPPVGVSLLVHRASWIHPALYQPDQLPLRQLIGLFRCMLHSPHYRTSMHCPIRSGLASVWSAWLGLAAGSAPTTRPARRHRLLLRKCPLRRSMTIMAFATDVEVAPIRTVPSPAPLHLPLSILPLARYPITLQTLCPVNPTARPRPHWLAARLVLVAIMAIAIVVVAVAES